jgi:hypothetical protein
MEKVIINPETDLESIGFGDGEFNVVYNFSTMNYLVHIFKDYILKKLVLIGLRLD